jgi:Ser/Thr protein kinase RdoA (MazF antagonist)
MRLLHSTVAAGDIGAFVGAHYAIAPVTSCRLLTRGFNDTYEVVVEGGARYAFRLGARRAHQPADLDYEAALLNHLTAAGVPVVRPVAARDGRWWLAVALPERDRPAMLFCFLEGAAPGPGAIRDACAQAETLARIHIAAQSFASPPPRFARDLDQLLRRAMTALATLPSMTGEGASYLTELAARLNDAVEARAARLSWGHCHGDCHGGNARITEGPSGPIATLFDFDDSGPGFLAYDLSVFVWGAALTDEQHLWAPFVTRYCQINPVGAVDLDAIRCFVAIRHIWLMGEYAIRADEWGIDWLGARWLARQVKFLRAWEERHVAGQFDFSS